MILFIGVGIAGLVINRAVGQVIGAVCPGGDESPLPLDQVQDTFKTMYEKADELFCTSLCKCYEVTAGSVNSTGAAGTRVFTSTESEGFRNIQSCGDGISDLYDEIASLTGAAASGTGDPLDDPNIKKIIAVADKLGTIEEKYKCSGLCEV